MAKLFMFQYKYFYLTNNILPLFGNTQLPSHAQIYFLTKNVIVLISTFYHTVEGFSETQETNLCFNRIIYF